MIEANLRNRNLSIIEDDASLARSMSRMFSRRLEPLAIRIFDYKPDNSEQIVNDIKMVNGRQVVVCDGLEGSWKNFYQKLSGLPDFYFVLNSGTESELILARKMDVKAFDKFDFNFDPFINYVLGELIR